MAAEPPILAAKPRDFKAAPFHSPRDFAARIHSPLSKFYLAREQSRQLRRLILIQIIFLQPIWFVFDLMTSSMTLKQIMKEIICQSEESLRD